MIERCRPERNAVGPVFLGSLSPAALPAQQLGPGSSNTDVPTRRGERASVTYTGYLHSDVGGTVRAVALGETCCGAQQPQTLDLKEGSAS